MDTVSATAAIAMLVLASSPRLAAAQRPPLLDSADVAGWADGLVPPALEAGDLPGALLVIVQGGRVLFQKGYGFAEVASRVPMDPIRTVVSVGSVSKLFTWTAVMQQVAAGRLDLDRDVNGWLEVPIPPAFGKPITLRHLMTHTAGFEERAFRTYAHPRPLAEHLRGTPIPERIDPPGHVVAYSNYGSMLAGHLVERVSGETFLNYIDRHVLGPLGMTRSSFRRPLPAATAPDLARSYDLASGDPNPEDALDHEEPSGDPSGHLTTTGADIARFMLAHLQYGRVDSVRLLDSATMALMHAPQVVPIPGAHPITLGFFRTDRNGREVLAHAGDIEDFHADLELLPAEQIGFFFLTNGTGVRHGLFGAGHQLRSRIFREFMDRYLPAPPEAEPPTRATALEHGRLLAGEYQMSRRPANDFAEVQMLLARAQMNLVIRVNPDGTVVTPPVLDFERGRERTWREVAPFQWREVGGTERLLASVEGGRVRALVPEHLFSFVLIPIHSARAARPNVILLAVAAVLLAAATLGLGVTIAVRRRRGRGWPAPLAATWLAAAVGTVHLLAWAWILTSGIPDREHGEIGIRMAQLIGLVNLGAAGLAWRNLRSAIWHRAGAATAVIAALVALALTETVWLSLGFHLLSWRLVY